MTERTNNNDILIYFKKSYINYHWYGLIGLGIGGIFFGFISFFAWPFHDLGDPIGLLLFGCFLLFFIIFADDLASSLRFLSKGSPALILSDQGITDQSSVKSNGFFIPYRDILGVKGVMLGRRRYSVDHYMDLATGKWNYSGFKRPVADRYLAWGFRAGSNGMLIRGAGDAYSIYLKLVNREKYAPKRKNPIYYDEGLIYNIFCGPLDIPVLELVQLIEERMTKHPSTSEGEEYAAKIRELRRGSD